MTREDAARQIDALADFYWFTPGNDDECRVNQDIVRSICELAAFLHS